MLVARSQLWATFATVADPDLLHTLGRHLADARERADDFVGAKPLAFQAVDRGEPGALNTLARLWQRANETVRLDRFQRFGLAGDGEPATGLDFGAYGGAV
ncbi:hypothetical protein [Dactylosporangium sp. CS-033363]|uniref:hypothetical protein n=1 Tax=Dactylosporangium sp. CS-033363 TaxID=3239935 RepID=UPI003D8E95FA